MNVTLHQKVYSLTTPAPSYDHEKKKKKKKKNITMTCKPMMMVCETHVREKKIS